MMKAVMHMNQEEGEKKKTKTTKRKKKLYDPQPHPQATRLRRPWLMEIVQDRILVVHPMRLALAVGKKPALQGEVESKEVVPCKSDNEGWILPSSSNHASIPNESSGCMVAFLLLPTVAGICRSNHQCAQVLPLLHLDIALCLP